MTGQSKLWFALGLLLVPIKMYATVPPGDKRTIFTAGEKVYPIHYRLGTSTILYFGLRPETVICGNKNYFNIEKIKEGISIQPLSNFSTNLTVLALGRRFLFFLTPANGKPDGFVDVKWIPPGQARFVQPLARHEGEVIREIDLKAKIGSNMGFSVLREKTFENGKRRIFEVELKNFGRKTIPATQFEVVASAGSNPLVRQVVVWEGDDLKANGQLRGRVIVSGYDGKMINFVVGYLGKSTKLAIKGGRN